MAETKEQQLRRLLDEAMKFVYSEWDGTRGSMASEVVQRLFSAEELALLAEVDLYVAECEQVRQDVVLETREVLMLLGIIRRLALPGSDGDGEDTVTAEQVARAGGLARGGGIMRRRTRTDGDA